MGHARVRGDRQKSKAAGEGARPTRAWGTGLKSFLQ
jgi:hypothetical protein